MALPQWAYDGLNELAPVEGSSENLRERFDEFRARVELFEDIVTNELEPHLAGLSDVGKRVVFAQASWAALYFNEKVASRVREEFKEAQRLQAEILRRLDELISLADEYEDICDRTSLSSGLPTATDLLVSLDKHCTHWSSIIGLPKAIFVAESTSSPAASFSGRKLPRLELAAASTARSA